MIQFEGANPACAAFTNVWNYNSLLAETGGVVVTITETRNTVDGSAMGTNLGNIQIAARGSVNVPCQFCFNTSPQRSIQSTWVGTRRQRPAGLSDGAGRAPPGTLGRCAFHVCVD